MGENCRASRSAYSELVVGSGWGLGAGAGAGGAGLGISDGLAQPTIKSSSSINKPEVFFILLYYTGLLSSAYMIGLRLLSHISPNNFRIHQDTPIER